MTAPMAVCPRDGEPLVMSFERRGKEFVCMVCGHWYEFLQPRAAEPSPELDARHKELYELYLTGERPQVKP